MSIINFSVKSLGGALNKVNSSAQISVSRDQKANVVMEGYIGAGRIKNDDGKYVASGYGRLPVQAALTGEGDKQRLVLEIAGGLRGVLFKNTKKKDDNDPDYTGRLESDDFEYGLFGRKVNSEAGEFISLSSTDAKPREQRGTQNSSSSQQNHPADDDGSVPF